jgi:hypothetical protein
MPYFKNTDDLVSVWRPFFERLARDPDVGPLLRKINLVVRFRLVEPEAVVTINAREDARPPDWVSVVFGASDLRADVTLTSSADFAHELWQGKANIMAALFGGKLRVEGDLGRAAQIAPALQPIGGLYARHLRDTGRGDLIAP